MLLLSAGNSFCELRMIHINRGKNNLNGITGSITIDSVHCEIFCSIQRPFDLLTYLPSKKPNTGTARMVWITT
jgi:hypothetical protein